MALTLQTSLIIFILLAFVIAFAGTRLTWLADLLADQTGWGEAIFGAILLGGITSLSGIITSITTAFEGHPQLAVSNAIGGIAAQTIFLAVADIFYRKANLEHASASIQNLMQGVMLIFFLGFILFLITAPIYVINGIHPGSLIIVILYIAGMRLTSKASEAPMWRPRQTQETVFDLADKQKLNKHPRSGANWVRFVFLGLVVGLSGYGIAETGIVIANKTGISETVMGSMLTAIVTSLPELITSIAAVRQGAVTLAVGGIIGGNTFDVLFVAFSDWAYQGSIFHAITFRETYLVILTLLLTTILIMGLLTRQKQGFGRIGWESFALLIGFIGGYALLFFF